MMILIQNQSFASEENAKSAKKAWSAFECSTFAVFANKDIESKALFETGYKEITKFLNALEAKEITEKELRSIVPLGIRFNLQGPSKDFIAGRIYAEISQNANDDIIKNDLLSGLPITDPMKWNTDEDLQVSIAKNKYSKGNCDFLK